MRFRTFTFLVVVVGVYSGCNKQDEVITHLPDVKAVSNSKDSNIVAQHFSVNEVCGSYRVSGVSSASDGIGRISVSNDTITVTMCTDSSIQSNSLVKYDLAPGPYPCGWNSCCSYPPLLNAYYQNFYPSDYQFAYQNHFGSGGVEVLIYFPAGHIDSIYISGNWIGNGCNAPSAYLYLNGVKIH
jgi:hypothetical protein